MYPHHNDYSPDGRWIGNSSIGNVGYQSITYADDTSAGDRWLAKVDAKTLQVVRTCNIEFGVRPSGARVVRSVGPCFSGEIRHLTRC
jgi:hypothetical protein